MEKERENDDLVLNRHHLIPKSKGGASYKQNVIKIDERQHRIRHLWCGNDTPVEALCRVLLWNEQVWTENFKSDLLQVLDNYLNNYYQNKTHKGIIKSEIQKVLELEELLC